MSPTLVKPRTKTKPETQRPPLWKVILLNDDFTPREFVVQVLKAVFRMNESQAYRVMMTAHQRGACVIAVYSRDVAETKAKEATEMGRAKAIRCISRPRRRSRRAKPNAYTGARRAGAAFAAKLGLLLPKPRGRALSRLHRYHRRHDVERGLFRVLLIEIIAGK